MNGNGVLIVEDEPFVRFVIADDFEDGGFTVFHAESSDEALALLEEHPEISVLLADIRIPGRFDGLGLLGEVGKRWPGVSLMATTGYHAPTKDALPPDAVFIAKPFAGTEAVDKARILMAQKR